MPMPEWQDQPENREYKRKLRDLQIPIPRWWPGRMNIEIVGGDLETGAVVAHLPVEGNPYFARVPAHGPTGGNTDVTLADLDRNHVRTEWVDGDWMYIVFGREKLDAVDVGHIRISMRSISLEVSSRAVTFDPTDHELFVVQAQGFDWQLLQNGSVHRYGDRFGLDTASAHLAELGYVVHSLDAGLWLDTADMHTALATALSFPGSYGRNLDALNDCLGDVARYSYGSDSNSAGTVLAIAGFDSLLDIDRPTALGVLDVFARQARLSALYGHAMLCLVETAQ
ncbi:MAG: barstar family protein [Rhodococcus sp. (in: high G+C Gram-positive bacteria)]|nr:barstar family protein [Rhodococcus sp. (in: high G+C Gram-positive bacteria)]